jgi:para-aminobenzoate synthetase component 1
LLSALRGRRAPILLDSAAPGPARFSILGFDPLEGVGEPPETLAGLRAYLGELHFEAGDPVPGPFHGGFLGALSYELGVAGEEPVSVTPDPWNAPRIAGGLYTDFLVHDHVSGRLCLVLGERPGDGRPPLEERRRSLEELLGGSAAPGPIVPRGPLVRLVSSKEHRRRVDAAREWIRRGEIYQANLAHRFARTMAGDPVDLYVALRAANPAPYMAYVPWGKEECGGRPAGVLLSASPELLLEYDGETARTRPIKGTAPRGQTPEEDRALAQALLGSAKDLAELTMIVDLERNDLGRVARTGTVEVEGLPTLQSFTSVHHLVADVTARPEPGKDAVDILETLFPGGSITGAPKLRAMEVIAELEGEGRGFFTGSAGFLDTRGQACFNILIRTLLWRPVTGEPDVGEVGYHVGGGITWASDAVAEDEETLHKGAALALALEGRA